MSRHVVHLVVVAGLFVAGCAQDAPTAATASTTTTRPAGVTSSTAAGQTTTTSGPDRTGCRHANTSSPATFDATQGTYATYITAFDESSSTVSFDVVQWLSGGDAIEAYHKDNPDDPDGPPNDYYIVNESHRVRSSHVSKDASVWLVRLRETGDAGLKPGSVAELGAYLAQGSPEDVYWLTMSGGSVVDICEQYRP